MILNPYRFGAPGGTDPYFSNVKALLHMDGADTSTTFTDVTGRTWTANGNAQIDTAQSVFGGASLLCDGTGDYIEAASSSDFNFTTLSDFTIEFRVRFNSVASRQIFCGSNSSAIYYFDFRRGGTNVMSFAGAGVVADGAATLSAGVWYAIAVTRASNTLRLFVDGAVDATQVGANNSSGTAGNFQIGSRGSGALPLNGWIDEFRYTNGVARYTANYTPATSAFPDS